MSDRDQGVLPNALPGEWRAIRYEGCWRAKCLGTCDAVWLYDTGELFVTASHVTEVLDVIAYLRAEEVIRRAAFTAPPGPT